MTPFTYPTAPLRENTIPLGTCTAKVFGPGFVMNSVFVAYIA